MTENTNNQQPNIGELKDTVYLLEGRVMELENDIHLLKQNFTKALRETQERMIEILRAEIVEEDESAFGGGIRVDKWE